MMDSDSLRAKGWEQLDIGGFTGVVGPFWRRRQAQGLELGLLVEERHSNNHLGTIHGGVVMTFADIALGSGVLNKLRENLSAPPPPVVTTSLQTQFIAVAHIGDFIHCQPEAIYQGKQLVFVRGLIKSGEKLISSAEGIWKILDKRN